MSNVDHDPVEDFFERERNEVVSHDGNDVHWQGIVHRARVQRRSRFLGYVAGVAAAGLVIGGVTYGAIGHNYAQPLTAATQDATTADRSAAPAAAAPDTRTTPGCRLSPEPAISPERVPRIGWRDDIAARHTPPSRTGRPRPQPPAPPPLAALGTICRGDTRDCRTGHASRRAERTAAVRAPAGQLVATEHAAIVRSGNRPSRQVVDL